MPLSFEDKLAIQELIWRSNRATDYGDAEGWADTFTRDGEFHGPNGRDAVGREQLIRQVRDRANGAADRAQHWVTNFAFDGDGDDAQAYSDFLFVNPGEVGGTIILMGWYDDRFRKVEGHWLFTKRVAHSAQERATPSSL